MRSARSVMKQHEEFWENQRFYGIGWCAADYLLFRTVTQHLSTHIPTGYMMRLRNLQMDFHDTLEALHLTFPPPLHIHT